MKKQYTDLLHDAGLLDRGNDANRHSASWAVVKACLCAGFYPNLIRVDPGQPNAILTPILTSFQRNFNGISTEF
jgi:hypothetical protein